MSYIKKSLSPDEEISTLFGIHWSTRTTLWFWCAVSVCVSGGVFYFYDKFDIPLLPVGLVVLSVIPTLWEWTRLKCLEQGVTNKRVILKKGVIAIKTEEMRLSSIETVEIVQSLMGRLCGYGTVKVTGRGLSDVIFYNIDDPMEVKRAIERADYVSQIAHTEEDVESDQ